jgi:hypothetical protein
MRHLLGVIPLLALSPTISWACTETDLLAGGEINCTELTINANALTFYNIPAITVRVSGQVRINGTLNLSGGNGVNIADTTDTQVGSQAGPGAGTGGWWEEIDDFGNPKVNPTTISDSPGAGQIATCDGGGGGGGFSSRGGDGLCEIDDPNQSPGIGGNTSSPFTGNFRGGFGGGSGKYASAMGTGGGGGGTIRIIAGDDVLIDGAILANGGNGGSVSSDGGGGGGGSGGAIWIQTSGRIEVIGILNAKGGQGGEGQTSGLGTNRPDGGSGGNGYIRLEASRGIELASANEVFPTPELINLPVENNTETLKSGISCGSITDGGSSGPTSNMLFGFALSFILMSLLKASARFKTKRI